MSRDQSGNKNRTREYDWREEYKRELENEADEDDEFWGYDSSYMRRNKSHSPHRKSNRSRGTKGRRRRYARDEDDDRAGGLIAIVILLAIIIAVAIFGLRFFWKGQIPWSAPDYEDTAEFEDNADKIEAERLNVAVLPDYVISEASPYILIPYPEDNVYEVEMVFRDQHTGKALYSTKRIRPGTVVRVQAMNFCKIGRNEFYVEVKLFDPKTWDEVESAVALETVIKRAEE